MNVICIIPARRNSKGIPNKNLIDFCGKPLLAWSILQAIESTSINDVYVSSDSNKILEAAEKYGALPIVRPSDLANDTATSESALLHALDRIERSGKKEVDLTVFLQATSPLREPVDIDGAICELLQSGSDSLLSVNVLDDICVFKLEGSKIKGITYDPFNRGRRQEREPLYHDNGSIYLFRPAILKKYSNRLGGKIATFIMPLWKTFEIDRMEDVNICEYYFKRKLLPYWKEKECIKEISAANIDLIVYDFDGVMTDNRVLILENGSEAIIANRGDGQGINLIKEIGIEQIIVSTEVNPVVGKRAKKIGLPVLQGKKDKAVTLMQYCKEANFDMDRVAFVGNDVNDLESMRLVGLPIAVFDAHHEIKCIAKTTLKTPGGGGVVREIADLLKQNENR